jgi:hypothetical protein
MIERAGVEDGPFLDRADLKLGHDAFAELLAVDGEVVDVDPAVLHLGQLLQREGPLNARRRLPERICRLGGEHRRVRGNGISFDDEGGQHVAGALTAHMGPSLFAAPSIR